MRHEEECPGFYSVYICMVWLLFYSEFMYYLYNFKKLTLTCQYFHPSWVILSKINCLDQIIVIIPGIYTWANWWFRWIQTSLNLNAGYTANSLFMSGILHNLMFLKGHLAFLFFWALSRSPGFPYSRYLGCIYICNEYFAWEVCSDIKQYVRFPEYLWLWAFTSSCWMRITCLVSGTLQ